jgi:hypothetical protein
VLCVGEPLEVHFSLRSDTQADVCMSATERLMSAGSYSTLVFVPLPVTGMIHWVHCLFLLHGFSFVAVSRPHLDILVSGILCADPESLRRCMARPDTACPPQPSSDYILGLSAGGYRVPTVSYVGDMLASLSGLEAPYRTPYSYIRDCMPPVCRYLTALDHVNCKYPSSYGLTWLQLECHQAGSFQRRAVGGRSAAEAVELMPTD